MNAREQIIDFGPEGQELEGTTWWKRDGSDHFTVRSILLGDTGLTIQTTDGRMISGDVMETYIQSDIPISIPKEAPVTKIDAAHLDELGDASASNFGSLKYKHDVQFSEPTPNRHHIIDPINEPIGDHDNKPTQTTPSQSSVEQQMIDRVLNKGITENLVSVIINPVESVDNSVVTLHTALNIDRKDIHDYLVARLAKYTQDMVSESVDAYLDSLGVEKQENPDTM